MLVLVRLLRRTHGFRYLLVLAIFAVTTSLLLTACNKEDRDVANKRQQTGANSESSANLFKIRYRPQWMHQAQFAGVYMAKQKGFYEDYGLNVEILPGGPNFPAYDNLQKNECDITQLFLLTALTRDAENNNLVNLAQLSQKSALMLVGKKSRGINSVKSMDGKKIGLWRTDFRDLSLIFMKQNNLNMDLFNVDFTIHLFLNDGIDLMNVMRYNEYHQIMQAGIDPEDLFTISFSDVGLNIVEDGLYCTRDYFNKYPQQCADFAQATMDGWLYAINHQEETIETVLAIMRKHHLPANRTHQAWMLKEMREIILQHPERIGLLRQEDFQQARGLLINQGNPVSKQEYESFYAKPN